MQAEERAEVTVGREIVRRRIRGTRGSEEETSDLSKTTEVKV